MQEPEVDFVLHTDGSGYQDGFGGYACLVKSQRHNAHKVRMAGLSGTTVERAEFEGLLMGLQTIVEILDCDNVPGREGLRNFPKTVLWISDRESLVKAVMRGVDGQPVFSRRSTPDLWVRFEFYEKLFKIFPRFTPRETRSPHQIVDRLASDGRLLIKNYLELPDNNVDILLKPYGHQEPVPPAS